MKINKKEKNNSDIKLNGLKSKRKQSQSKIVGTKKKMK